MINQPALSNKLPTDLFFPRIAAGVNHCLAIQVNSNQGQDVQYYLVGWGSSEHENLGQPDALDQVIHPSPVRINLEKNGEIYLPVQVAVGNQHSLILAIKNLEIANMQDQEDEHMRRLITEREKGDKTVIFSTGSNDFGQLGRQVIDLKQEEDQDDDDENEDDDFDEEDKEGSFKITQVVESISKVILIACGSNYSMALDSYGFVYTWGEGATGCLGSGTFQDAKRPQKIDFQGIRIKYIAAGPAHAACLSEGGELYTWGIGNYGQLGNGTNSSSNVPIAVNKGSLNEKVIDYVSCGAMHTACVSSDGFAHTFGFNKNGQLGTGDFLNRSVPGKVAAIQNFFVCYVKCGGNTTFVFTQERLVFAFGSNSKGRLGIKDDLGSNYPEPKKLDLQYFKSKSDFVYQMALSYHYGLALLEKGKIVSWGLPFKGCLGRDLQAEMLPTQDRAEDEDNNQILDALKNAELDDGDEDNNKLQEMLTNVKPDLLQQWIEPKVLESSFLPMKNNELKARLSKEIRASQQLIEVKCGTTHTVALTDAGEVWVWGSNQFMQHGMTNQEIARQLETRKKYFNVTTKQTIQMETFPTQVAQFTIRENKRVTYLATGYEYIFVVENRRNLYSWGRNDQGQLGLGQVSDFVVEPTKLEKMEGQLIKAVACGEDHTMILTEGGKLYAIGSPADGKLGLGQRNTQVSTADEVPGISGVSQICVGPHHTMALVADKNYNERIIMSRATKQEVDATEKYVIYTWGNGYGGKLGHSNMENQYFPKLLQTKYTFKSISAGTNHSGAISSDDRMIVWGIGAYLSISKPEEDDTQQQKVRKGREVEVEPYYILSPIQHPEFATRRYQELYLFDKYNLALTKQKKVQYWGMFDYDFQKRMKEEMKGKSESQKERIIESLLGVSNLLPSDIQYSKLSCSFNHAYACSVNEIDGVSKKYDLYTWGLDGMTGRLGLGYEFLNPEKENEMQLDQDKKQDIVINQKIDDIEKERKLPTQLQFINQYLEFQYKMYLQLLDQQNKPDEEEQQYDDDDFDDDKSKVTKKNSSQNKEQLQLGGTRKQQISERVCIAQNLGIYDKGVVYKIPVDQYLQETKPEIYKCAYTREPEPEFDDDSRAQLKKRKKVNLFDESVVDDVYESVRQAEEENRELFKKIRETQMVQFKKFKDEAKLTIINKIQREPFNVKFTKEKKDEKKDSKKGGSKKQKQQEKHGQANTHQKKDEKVHHAHEQFHLNSHAYKILFSLLQIHPCYLINMYRNIKNINKKDFVDLVQDVFGQYQNDKRKYRIYISLAIQILKIDLKILAKDANSRLNFNAEEQEESCLYTFTQLFMNFQKQFTPFLSFTLRLYQLVEQTIEKAIYQGPIPKILKNIALAFHPKYIDREELIVKPKIEAANKNKFFEERANFIRNFFNDFFKDTEFKNKVLDKYEQPKPIRELLLKAFETVKPVFLQKSITIDTMQCKLLGLYFLNFQKGFMKRMQKVDSARSGEEKLETRIINVECFLDLFRVFINNENSDIEEPWWSTITDGFSDISNKRGFYFNYLAQGGTSLKGQKIMIFSDAKKFKDIYLHSIELSDDVLQPRVRSIVFVTKLLKTNLKDIIYIKAEDQDVICQFNKQLNQDCNYLHQKPTPAEMEQRVILKLKSRQLLFIKKSLQLKFCQSCNCFAAECFLSSEDPLPYQRFNQWNPVSLAALLIAIVPCFTKKKEFDDFISGQSPDVASVIKKKIAQQMANQQFANTIRLKDFEKSFNEKVQFNIDQSDEVTDDKKQQILRENKKVLRELKMTIQERLIQIYIYIHTMERHMAIQDGISKFLNSKISQYQESKVLLYQKVISNCYFGMANKELIKPLVSNPVSMVSQIKDAIRKISTSQEIFENIDVFKKNSQTPSALGIFGTYYYTILFNRKIVKEIDPECLEVVRKQTKQTVDDKKITDRLLFIFKMIDETRTIQIILVYSEIEFNLKYTLSCGLLKPVKMKLFQPFEPIEFVLDIFQIETALILEMRKIVIMSVSDKTTPEPQRLGKYTRWYQKGLMELLDELTNHAVIYDHIYQEPDQKKHRRTHSRTKPQ